ncbi:MAG: hypothetical protein FJ009_20670 [Chloroflexi bacterium]|nr:hypothetical protein [Chloroflexota bacterium]
MTIQSVTLRLSETILRQVQQATDVLQRPMEEVLTATLAAALPGVDDAPPEMRDELTRMTWFSDKELWEIAHNAMSAAQQEQLHALTETQTRHPLAGDEQETLDALRREYGRVTLRKSRAFALLSLRGGRPLLADS